MSESRMTVKALARRVVVAAPPIRRLRDDRARWRADAKEARAEAAKHKREASRLRAQFGVPEPTETAPKGLAPHLAALDKINFGCGYDKREGFLNVDVDKACAPDLLVRNGEFSVLPRGHYREILANDVLEHITHRSTLSVLLEWADFLADGASSTSKPAASSVPPSS